MTGYLDRAFKDKKRLTTLEIEIIWRLNSCKWGYAKNQATLISWTDAKKPTMSRAINKLMLLGYIQKTNRGYEPIILDEESSNNETLVPIMEQNKTLKSSNIGTKVAQNGTKVPILELNEGSKSSNNETLVPILELKVPSMEPKVPFQQQRTIYTKHNKNIIESMAEKTAHTLDVNKIKNNLEESEIFKELDEDIKTDNRYMLAGQRPLKKYPDIWLSQSEFEQVKHAILEAKVDGTKVFQKVVNKLPNYRASGRSITMIPFASWLSGWALTEVVNDTASLARLDRARGVR